MRRAAAGSRPFQPEPTARMRGRRGGLSMAPTAGVPDVMSDATAPPAAAPASTSRRSLLRLLVAEVQFTPAYIGFLGYIFVITTLSIPVGDVSMGVAVAGLLLPQPGGYRFPPMIRWLVALLAWAAVGYFSTPYPEAVSMELYALLKIFVIAFVAVNVLRTRGQVFFLIVFFLACYAFWPARAGLFAYFIYGGSGFGGRTAWKGVFGNPNDMAAISLLPLSMCIGLFFSARNRTLQLASFVGIGVLSMVVVLTQSRGALVAMLVFAVASLLTTRGKQRIRLAVAFAVVSAAAVPFIPQSAWDRYAGLLKIGGSKADLTAAGDQGSADQRFEIWKVARRISGEHVIMGVGFGAYKSEHQLVSMRPEFRPTARGRRDPHSTYLAVAAETGLVGLACFLAVFGTAVLFAERVRRAARHMRPDDAMLLLYLQLGLLAYFVAGIWGSYEKVPITYVHAAVLWAFASVVQRSLANQGVRVR